MATKKFTDMRSVSFTEEQGKALDVQAKKEGRKAGNLIRFVVCNYLEEKKALSAAESLGDASYDDEESQEELFVHAKPSNGAL